MTMRQWMASALPTVIIAKIKEGGFILEEAVDLALRGAVEKSLYIQSNKALNLMDGVWGRLSSMICADCKSSLQAVKGVAGKYRLTNKPPPENASPFVVTILNPLR